MPPVTLYSIVFSPPCRMVEMVARLINVPLVQETVDIRKKQEDYLKIYPLHKVPFMIDGDVKIGESRAICSYLINKYKPDHHLYPQNPDQRAKIDEMLHFDNGVHQTFMGLLTSAFANRGKFDPAINKNLQDQLKYLDHRLNPDSNSAKFVVGDQLTLADVSIMSTMCFPKAVDFDVSGLKNLNAYMDRVRNAIPCYSEINDEPHQVMEMFMKRRLAKASEATS